MTAAGLLRVRLLTVVLAGAATACDDANESRQACYLPDHTSGASLDPMPSLPCLAHDDARLQVLQPSCSSDFSVASGPAQQASASGQAMCCYTIHFDTISSCSAGRPLRSGGAQVVAPLSAGGDRGG